MRHQVQTDGEKHTGHHGQGNAHDTPSGVARTRRNA